MKNCENNYHCKCKKCQENRNNVVCPFCGGKLKSIEKCPHCNKSLELKEVAKELKLSTQNLQKD